MIMVGTCVLLMMFVYLLPLCRRVYFDVSARVSDVMKLLDDLYNAGH